MKRATLVAVVALIAGAALLPTSGAVWVDATDSSGTVAARQPIRVTTYEIGAGEFTGAAYTLSLDQPLAADYFVMIRGSAGDGQVTTRPSTDSVRVVADPFSLGSATGGSELDLARLDTTTTNNQQSDWRGTVTVVESPDSASTDGFRLIDIVEVTLTAASPSTTTSTAAFTVGQTVPYGGIRGGGVTTDAAGNTQYRAQWARLALPGSGQLLVEGSGIPSGRSATYTVYLVEWGASWTIQHAYVEGSDSGNGVNSPGEYTQAPIVTAVERVRSWVIAFGNTTSGTLGGGWHGNVFTLGNGVSASGTESQVAVGAERGGTRRADVYVHTHPRLQVDHVFGADNSIGRNQASGTVAVSGPLGPETRSSASTSGTRVAVFTNTSNGNGNAYPRPIFWTRHEASGSMTWQRARPGQQGAYWAQSVDFGEIWR